MASRLLAGKSAIVTGGVTGIGRAIALGFLRQGAAVTVNHLEDEASAKHYASLIEEAPKGSQLQSITGDIGRKEVGSAISQAAVSNFGGVDTYVANAGVSQFRDFLTSVFKILSP